MLNRKLMASMIVAAEMHGVGLEMRVNLYFRLIRASDAKLLSMYRGFCPGMAIPLLSGHTMPLRSDDE